MPVMDQAFVTLATNDAYSQGALVVGKCLQQHRTSRLTVVMVTSHVSSGARYSYNLRSNAWLRFKVPPVRSDWAALAEVFHQVKEVEVLENSDRTHLNILGRPELGITLTKLHCWALTEYTKCVFLDADMLVLCNVDELFDREEFSAAPDPGWPDCFNSGAFVFRPSLQTHSQLLAQAAEHGSFDGGDQGLLNSFFRSWATEDINKHLPFIYNLSSSTIYSYLPAFRKFGQDAKIVHFLGAVKPWHCKYDHQTGQVYLGDGSPCPPHLGPFLKQWWAEYWKPVPPSFTQTYISQEPETHEESVTPQLLGETQVDTAPGEEGVASEWTHPQDPPPNEEDRAQDLGVEDSSQLEEPVAVQAESVPELAAHQTPEEDDLEQRRRWEAGQADYLGKDAFDNIRKKLDSFLL